MREWIPVPGSAKQRLAVAALERFGANGFEPVAVTDLAAAAGVTTGSLYHHFGSKGGLYGVVRTEAERRAVDRMRGAAAACEGRDGLAVAWTALLVAFDYACEAGVPRLLGEPHPEGGEDRVGTLVAELLGCDRTVLAGLLAAAWRAALLAVADGADREGTRAALEVLASSREPS